MLNICSTDKNICLYHTTRKITHVIPCNANLHRHHTVHNNKNQSHYEIIPSFGKEKYVFSLTSDCTIFYGWFRLILLNDYVPFGINYRGINLCILLYHLLTKCDKHGCPRNRMIMCSAHIYKVGIQARDVSIRKILTVPRFMRSP